MEQLFYDCTTGRYFTTTMEELITWEFRLLYYNKTGITGAVSHNFICEHVFGIPRTIIGDDITYNLPVTFEINHYDSKYGKVIYSLNVSEMNH